MADAVPFRKPRRREGGCERREGGPVPPVESLRRGGRGQARSERSWSERDAGCHGVSEVRTSGGFSAVGTHLRLC